MDVGEDMNVGIGSVGGTLSGFGIGISFSAGVCMVTLVIIFAWYFLGRFKNSQDTPPPANSDINIIVKKGLDEATLGEYPKLIYSKLEANIKRNDDDLVDICCPICLVEYSGNDVVRLLPSCNHIFHQKCVDPWLRLHASCPMCRKSPLKDQLTERPQDDNQPAEAVERV